MGTMAAASTMALPTTARDTMAMLGTTPLGWCTKGETAITAGIVTGGTTTGGIMTAGINMLKTGRANPLA